MFHHVPVVQSWCVDEPNPQGRHVTHGRDVTPTEHHVRNILETSAHPGWETIKVFNGPVAPDDVPRHMTYLYGEESELVEREATKRNLRRVVYVSVEEVPNDRDVAYAALGVKQVRGTMYVWAVVKDVDHEEADAERMVSVTERDIQFATMLLAENSVMERELNARIVALLGDPDHGAARV